MAGGKGVNVASVLTQRGVPVLATGLLGGRHRRAGARRPRRPRRPARLLALCGGVAPGRHGRLGGRRRRHGLQRARAARAAPGVDGLPRATSRPSSRRWAPGWSWSPEACLPGCPPTPAPRWCAWPDSRGARSIVDTSGGALTAALASGPDLVKPNRDELREVTGEQDLVAGARALLGLGAREVVVSGRGRGPGRGEGLGRGAAGGTRHPAGREPHRGRRRRRGGPGGGARARCHRPRRPRRRGGLVGRRRAPPAGRTGPPGRHRPPAPARAGRAGDDAPAPDQEDHRADPAR